MVSKPTLQLTGAILALVVAGFLGWREWKRTRSSNELAYFYDLSERQLFTAHRTSVPPIVGINDSVEDGVRAVVISTNGQAHIRNTWQIAYLEKYSPELRQQMHDAQAQGQSPAMGRSAAQAHRFVKRVSDTDWTSLATPEGERLVSEWTQLGTSENPPTICIP